MSALKFCIRVFLFIAGIATTLRAEHEGKAQIVLLGDSTTECSIPRKAEPKGVMFEEMVRLLLADQKDLPPANVINSGVSGEYIRRLLDVRYDKQVKDLPGVDYLFIRYGINDRAKRENFEENYIRDYHELLERLRRDHPAAKIVIMSAIPFSDPQASAKINALNKKVSEDEMLPWFDIYPRYAAELKKQGENSLNYRRFALDKIPENRRSLAMPFVIGGKPAQVVVMDTRLDAVYGDLPGWYGDRHPNPAGYAVIADETVKYLAPLMRNEGRSAR